MKGSVRDHRLLTIGAAALLAIATDPLARDASALPASTGHDETTPTATREAPSAARGRAYFVAAIGDSLTDPRVGGGRYLAHLAQACPKSRFDSYGVGGQQTIDMRARFVAEIFAPGKPRYTHVVVLGGVNDLFGGAVDRTRLERIEAQLAAMYVAAHEHGAKAIAMTVPPWGHAGTAHELKVTAALNAWILASPADHAIDLSFLECGAARSLCVDVRKTYDDMVHWNDRGHARVAAALHRAVFADCE